MYQFFFNPKNKFVQVAFYEYFCTKLLIYTKEIIDIY